MCNLPGRLQKMTLPTVDGLEIRRYNQLRLVVYPIIHRSFQKHPRGGGDGRILDHHQKYHRSDPTNSGWCCNVLQDEGFWYTKRFPEDGLKKGGENTGDVRFLQGAILFFGRNRLRFFFSSV